MAEIQKTPEKPLTDQLPESLEMKGGLSIYRCGAEDASFVFELSQDEQVSRFIPWAATVDSIVDAENVIQGWVESAQQVRYVVVSDNQPAGIFGVWKREEPGYCETGSAFIPMYRGLGIANKVYAAIEPYLAASGFNGVVSTVSIVNTSSQAAVIKRGFTEVSRDETNIRFEKRIDT